jgi:hypothetical protein
MFSEIANTGPHSYPLPKVNRVARKFTPRMSALGRYPPVEPSRERSLGERPLWGSESRIGQAATGQLRSFVEGLGYGE